MRSRREQPEVSQARVTGLNHPYLNALRDEFKTNVESNVGQYKNTEYVNSHDKLLAFKKLPRNDGPDFILRQDLTGQARQLVERTISYHIQNATDYASEFSIQVLKIALVFNSHEVTNQRVEGPTQYPFYAAINTDRYMAHHTLCPKKVEESLFDQDMDILHAIFAGTDNGIVKTTETVYFDLDRFAYRLQLHHISRRVYGKWQSTTAFMQLPGAHHRIKQLKQGTGLDIYMKSPEKRKKTPGEQVSAAKAILSSYSLRNCKTPAELEEAARIHRNHQDAIKAINGTFI
ncbi:uncharacterized protein ATC70_007967 [Mucor velutinosus]|uniref:Uncharacterized protein n=1 Tax=Mucor velutinosus TaxID=708070 RepID=A0AAN7HJT6_9FUNG|nr:hypothetical protein ATC70_007967 [Mucor velutinosus]